MAEKVKKREENFKKVTISFAINLRTLMSRWNCSSTIPNRKQGKHWGELHTWLWEYNVVLF